MDKQSERRSILREIISWAAWILGAVLLAFFVNNVIIVNAMVISGSMETTIMTGDKVLGSRLAYMFSSPERFDVIVFHWPDNRDELPFVKRIIGLPGETVTIRDGQVFINDSAEPLDESAFLNENTRGSFGPYTVPAGHYFVMGDNRNHSNDSRSWLNTFVPAEDILGKVLLKFYPGFKIIK